MMKRMLLILTAAALAAMLAACGAAPANDAAPETTTEPFTIHEVAGETPFVVGVVVDNMEIMQWQLSTDQVYLADALLEIGLVEGDEGPRGLMITRVAGIRADFELDQAWWQVLVNGEASLVGVSQIEIEPGAVYTLEKTPA